MEGTTAETVVASAPEAIEEAVDNPSESNQATTESNGMAQPETAGALGPSADDPMLGFLTLLAKVERPACANCESKDLSPMFFCNTCGNLWIRHCQSAFLFLFLSFELIFITHPRGVSQKFQQDKPSVPCASKTRTAPKCSLAMTSRACHPTQRSPRGR